MFLLLAFQWWGELVTRTSGESAVEDVLTDAPGLALVFAPLMFGGLVFTLASFALGVESLIRRGEDANVAGWGVAFSAFVLMLTASAWVLLSAGS